MSLSDLFLSGQGAKAHVLESNVWKTLLYAPRKDLHCSWLDCPYTDDVFGSIQALIQHIKLRHSSPPLIQSYLKKPAIPCRFNKACKHVANTRDDLLKHVKNSHLGILRSTCYRCSYQETSFLGMLGHLETRHSIRRSDLPVTFFGAEPRKPVIWPTFTGPIESHIFTVPLVANDPEVSAYADPVASDEMSPNDVLEEDERDAEIMSLNAKYSKSKGKQRAEPETDIWMAANPRMLNIAAMTAAGLSYSYHAGLRSPPEKAKLSYPLSYKTGERPEPRRPPVIGNYFGMKETILPKLMEKS